MFEVGFTEIILILGIALLVLGPEKLPKVAAQVGRWAGRARAMARNLKEQLDEEVLSAERTYSRPGPAYTPPASPNLTVPPPSTADVAAASSGIGAADLPDPEHHDEPCLRDGDPPFPSRDAAAPAAHEAPTAASMPPVAGNETAPHP